MAAASYSLVFTAEDAYKLFLSVSWAAGADKPPSSLPLNRAVLRFAPAAEGELFRGLGVQVRMEGPCRCCLHVHAPLTHLMPDHLQDQPAAVPRLQSVFVTHSDARTAASAFITQTPASIFLPQTTSMIHNGRSIPVIALEPGIGKGSFPVRRCKGGR